MEIGKGESLVRNVQRQYTHLWRESLAVIVSFMHGDSSDWSAASHGFALSPLSFLLCLFRRPKILGRYISWPWNSEDPDGGLWQNVVSCLVLSALVPQSFLDTEGGSQKATVVVLLVLGISSLKIPNAFLICSRAQRHFAHTYMLTFPTDLPSQIFYLFSNYWVIA